MEKQMLSTKCQQPNTTPDMNIVKKYLYQQHE